MTVLSVCERCQGEGRIQWPRFWYRTLEGIDKPVKRAEPHPCYKCKGKGWIPV